MIDSIRRIPVAAALLAFTSLATVCWVLLGSPNLPKKRVRGPRGLANYGRACYMNSVLQALASSSIIENWLSKSSSSLQQSLLKCLKVLNRQEDDPNEEVSPTYLFSALRSQGFVITGDEQDAHELFQGLLDAIESDQAQVATAMESDPLKLSEETETGAVGIFRKLGENAAIITSPVADEYSSPFCGTMTCRVENQKSKSPTRSTFFNNVTLYLPPIDQKLVMATISLEHLLQTLVALEKVESSTKQQSFARLPKCLVLHIQRTGWCPSGTAFKRDEKVVFPLVLNMDKFIYSQQLYQRRCLGRLTRSATIAAHDSTFNSTVTQPQVKKDSSRSSYGLCSVISHLGNIESGHYITFRKYATGGRVRWYVCSDGDVRQVNIEQVLSANPYILIYEKMSNPTDSSPSPHSPPSPTVSKKETKSCEK